MSKVSYGTITLTDTIDTDLLGGHFIYNSDGAGVIQNIGNGPSNWGYNTWIGSTGIQLRDAATPYAILNGDGLTLSKGGIKAKLNFNDKVYLSSEDYGANLTINNHEASNWREVIGSKFGVDAEGNLYANNAHIAGAVHMESGTIDYGVIIGQADSVHISLSQEQIGFWRGSEDNDINKTAYITNQYMYIPYTVVLNEMQVGTKPKYKEVENPSESNPSEQGWYEIINGEYILTTDTAIVSGKTYYEIDGDIPLWSWRKMDGGNLRLMWLGGEV